MGHNAEVLEQPTVLDEDQQRRIREAGALFGLPEIHARLHEFDEECQTEPARRM